jgi:hypothetical protein
MSLSPDALPASLINDKLPIDLGYGKPGFFEKWVCRTSGKRRRAGLCKDALALSALVDFDF